MWVVLGLVLSASPWDDQALVSIHSTADQQSASLSLDKVEYDLRQTILTKVSYPSSVKDEEKQFDYVGLFDRESASKPLSLALVRTSKGDGTVAVQASKVGILQLRLVRPPTLVLATVDVTVLPACPDDCSKNGKCVKGKCECRPGYESDDCSSLKSKGLILSIVDPNAKIQDGFQQNYPITVTIRHAQIADDENLNPDPRDYVGIHHASSLNNSRPIVFQSVPRISRVANLTVPSHPDQYVVRYTGFRTLSVLAQSEPFQVFPRCQNRCSYIGMCAEGKCVCPPPTDLDDCSRSPGMVNMTLENDKDKYPNSLISFVWWRNETLKNVFADNDMISICNAADSECVEPVIWKYATASMSLDPDVIARRGKWKTGQVSFTRIPQGKYVAKYFRTGKLTYFTTPSFEVYPNCVHNCSYPNGVCYKGACKCNEGWTGISCFLGTGPFKLEVTTKDVYRGKPLTVKFLRPVGAGFDSDLIGILKDPKDNNKDGLLDYEYATADKDTDPSQNFESGTLTLTPPVTGKSMIIRYVNSYDQGTKFETQTFDVYDPCPKDCCSHGTCFHGVCQCNDGYEGKDCSWQQGSLVIQVPNHVTIAKSIEWAAVNVTRPLGWYIYGDFVGIYESSMQDSEAQKPKMFQYANEVNVGSFYFGLTKKVPGPGHYQVWYVRPNATVVAKSPMFDIE